MAPRHQHGPRGLARPQESTEHSLATGARRTTPDPSLNRAMDPDMVLGIGLCLDIFMAPGDSISHPDQHGSRHDIVLAQLYGPRCPTRPCSSAWPSVTTGSLDINSGLDCCRVTDPDMAFCSNPGPEGTMTLGDTAGHSDQDVTCGSMVLRMLHGCRLQSRLHVSLWPLTVT